VRIVMCEKKTSMKIGESDCGGVYNVRQTAG
jgi:hypothetical protein